MFLWGEGTDSDILDAGVLHLVENESDHCPIFCNIALEEIVPAPQKHSSTFKQKPSWKKATSEEKETFKVTVDDKLNNVRAPDSRACRNPKCNIEEHRIESDNYLQEVIDAISSSAVESLPLFSSGESNTSHTG